MLATTESVAIVGTEAFPVRVEMHIATGVPCFTLVGLPAKSVREAEQRTRSALLSSEQRWPPARVVANLAPGALRKEGTHFDLAIAMAVLAADGRLETEPLKDWIFMGELGLDGSVRSINGVLAAAIAGRTLGRKGLVCARGNASEAAMVEGIDVIPVSTLSQCIRFFKGDWMPDPIDPSPVKRRSTSEDMSDVRGQETPKRALEISAAGGHNVLMCGPPGSGKTMLARRLPGILPNLSLEESFEITRVHSVAGLLGEDACLLVDRPFRAPHHHISVAGLIGGGPGIARPGEVSLAHHGVLFLDEIALYARHVLDSLRGPLEDGRVRIARAGGVVSYPCRFSLIGAMNPCACGREGDPSETCVCSDVQRRSYATRLSGPLIDRFDLRVSVDRPSTREILGPREGESSEVIRDRVERARLMQTHRYASSTMTNASAPKDQLQATATNQAKVVLGRAAEALSLTGRGIDRFLRVSRTIADLNGDEDVGPDHVKDAVTFRFSDTTTSEAA